MEQNDMQVIIYKILTYLYECLKTDRIPKFEQNFPHELNYTNRSFLKFHPIREPFSEALFLIFPWLNDHNYD